MTVKVQISVYDAGQKIMAIKEWRSIVGTESGAFGLVEAKNFIESRSGKGYVDVVFTDTQFARFVITSSKACNGGEDYIEGFGPRKRPDFRFDSPEMISTVTYDFTR